MDTKKISEVIHDLLLALGEDPDREELRDTPARVARMYSEMLSAPDLTYTTFDKCDYDGMVILKNIKFCSMCEHHLMPFFGEVSIAYVPNKKIIGISKLARVVEKYARRLQVQERLTGQILDDIKKNLDTDDVAVYVEAKHLCMVARGVKKYSANTVTAKFSGVFKKFSKRRDFYFLLNDKKKRK
jgi:GTP cyclohydrolase I